MEKAQIKEQLKSVLRAVFDNTDLTAKNDKWITIKPNGEEGKGKHLLLKDGESPKEAIDRTYGNEDFEKETKSSPIDENRHQKVKKTDYSKLAKEIVEKEGIEKIKENLSYPYSKDYLWKLTGRKENIDTTKLKEEVEKHLSTPAEKERKKYQEIIDKYDKKQSVDKNDKGESWYDRASVGEIKTDIKEIERINGLLKDALHYSKYRNELQEKLSSEKDKLKVNKEDLTYLKAHLAKKQNKATNSITEFLQKGEKMNEFIETFKNIFAAGYSAANEAKEKEEKHEEEAENKCKNEEVDKRKLIDEVAGMMKSAGCSDEIIKTAIKDMEKESYDKSEAGTADNSKAKNEEEKADDKKADKEDKKADNAEEEKKEEEYKELKEKTEEEAMNKAKNEIFGEASANKSSYISREERIELGMKY